jgi:hypothetical protein
MRSTQLDAFPIDANKHLVLGALFWVLATAFYALILFRIGYIFGGNDQLEILPYAQFLNNTSLFSSDFYIQQLVASPLNERSFMGHFLALLLNVFGESDFEWVVWVLHFAATLALIRGCFLVASRFLAHSNSIWAALFTSFVVLEGINLGGNELYYNYLVSSYLAQVLGIWVLYFFLSGLTKPILTWVLLLLATAFHPLIGLQIFCCLAGAWLWTNKGSTSAETFSNWLQKPFALGVVAYIFLAGSFIFLLQQNYNNCANTPESQALFFEIQEFRHPHHYFPEYFPLKNYVLLVPFMAFGAWFFRRKNSFIFCFFIIAALGLLVYTLNLWTFRFKSVLSLQWFSTTLWLKFLSAVALWSFFEKAVLSFFEKKNAENMFPKLLKTSRLGNTLLLLVGTLAFAGTTPSGRIFKQKNYDLPFYTKPSEVEWAYSLRTILPADAFFLIPPQVTTFKYAAQRSSFIDYKTIAHNCRALEMWYSRFQKLYKLGLNDRRNKTDITLSMEETYRQLSANELKKWRKDFSISHLLTYADVVLPFEEVSRTEKYVIYRIPD